MSMLRFHLCGRCSAGASGCAAWLADDAKEGFCNYLDRMDGKVSRRRKRVACASGSGLFFSYVIDDSGTCSSFLVQNGDSTVYYISAVGGRSVKFPYANLTSLPMQERLLSVVDEAKGGVE